MKLVTALQLIFMFVVLTFLGVEVSNCHNEEIAVEEYKTVQDLYIMHSKDYGLYKIGRSIDPVRRLREVEQDNRVSVEIEKIYRGMGDMEPVVHNFMERKNVLVTRPDGSKGNEWFDLDSLNLLSIDSFLVVLGYDARGRKELINQ